MLKNGAPSMGAMARQYGNRDEGHRDAGSGTPLPERLKVYVVWVRGPVTTYRVDGNVVVLTSPRRPDRGLVMYAVWKGVERMLERELMMRFVGHEVRARVLGGVALVRVGPEKEVLEVEVSTEDWIEFDVALRRSGETGETSAAEHSDHREEHEEGQHGNNNAQRPVEGGLGGG